MFVRLIGEREAAHIPMLKSNFPELVLFELRIYRVEREMNIQRCISGSFCQAVYITTTFKIQTFVYGSPFICLSNVLKTYYCRSNRGKIGEHTLVDAGGRK